LARERDAVAEALNLIDDQRAERREQALALLVELERAAPFPGPPRVGLTGAPGAGKSTLLDALVRALRRRGATIGVLAVDPSSRRSGGALLGDRVRVRSGAQDRGVFFRSMAARMRLGGLADATWASLVVLAAVFDRVFVETVGVGQSESEVAELVDSVLYVAQPGAGDTLQFMKAGVLEHPDLYVVNKADLGAVAERTATELEAGLALATRSGSGWRPPVLVTSARDGAGIEPLVAALDAHRRFLEASGTIRERRARGRLAFVLDALARRYGSYGLEQVGGAEAVAARVREESAASGFELVLALGREIEERVAKGSAS
jgi:LAO/AO transport system kinase